MPFLTRRCFLKTAASATCMAGFPMLGKAEPKSTPAPYVEAHPDLEQFVEKIPESLDGYYHESHRPGFHYTSYKNWTSDPNGLVYHEGIYHLFYQYNPMGRGPVVPFWGHAVSEDLIHWEQKPCTFPVSSSGGSVVDVNNTSGLQKGDTPLIFAFRGNGSIKDKPGLRVAYSEDGAKTWKDHSFGDPRFRKEADPMVFWHEPTKRWVRIMFYWPDDRFTFRFWTSPNLTDWTEVSSLKHTHSECPDMYELAVDGNPNQTKWVFNVGNGMYDIGHFDGKKFTIESGRYLLDHGDFYASRTWSNIPKDDGRTIHIAWMYRAGPYPGMPFSDQLTFPCTFTLQTCPEGLRVCRKPIREIEKLYDKVYQWENLELLPESEPLSKQLGEMLDIEMEVEVKDALAITLDIRRHPLVVDVKKKEITFNGKSMPVSMVDGRIRLRLLVDRTSVEIFANQGQSVLTRFFWPDPEEPTYTISAQDGPATIHSMTIRTLKSIWPPACTS